MYDGKVVYVVRTQQTHYQISFKPTGTIGTNDKRRETLYFIHCKQRRFYLN